MCKNIFFSISETNKKIKDKSRLFQGCGLMINQNYLSLSGIYNANI